jgi:hypothetical protein
MQPPSKIPVKSGKPSSFPITAQSAEWKLPAQQDGEIIQEKKLVNHGTSKLPVPSRNGSPSGYLNINNPYAATLSSASVTASSSGSGSWSSWKRPGPNGAAGGSTIYSSTRPRSTPISKERAPGNSMVTRNNKVSAGSYLPRTSGIGVESSALPRYRPQLARNWTQQNSSALLQAPEVMVPRTQSVNSSNSSRSDTNSQQNFSYPRNHSSTSESPRHSIILTMHESGINRRDSSPGADITGGDGQRDMIQYRSVERSTSNSTHYSPEALRKLHGGVSPNLDFNEDTRNIYARPHLVSRTATQYSRLTEAALASRDGRRPQLATRRASYSSATGISPVPETYMNSFSTTSSERQPLSRELSNSRGTSFEARTSQFDGALLSPQGPSMVWDLAVGGTFMENNLGERRRVDDFSFLNTFESTPRPYTPDKFAVEAGLTTQDASTTTRHSSQRSRRTSLDRLSKKSAGHSFNGSSGLPPTRNVLRKRNTSQNSAQFDGDEFEMSISRSHTLTDIRSSLRSRLGGRPPGDTYSTDIPHTATTCAGPSRGLIREDSLTSLANTSVPASRTSGSFFKLTKLGSKYGTLRSKVGARLTKERRRSKAFSPPTIIRSLRHSLSLSALQNSAQDRAAIPKDTNGKSSNASPISARSGSSQQTFAEDDRSPLGAFLHEGKQVLRQARQEGLSAALDDLRDRRELDKAYRYGAAGRKVKAFMKGARPEGPEKRRSFLGSNRSSWARTSLNQDHGRPSRIPLPRNSSQRDESRKMPGVPTSVDHDRYNQFLQMDGVVDDQNMGSSKKSAFTEIFERSRLSREKSTDSRRSTSVRKKSDKRFFRESGGFWGFLKRKA